MAVIFFRGPPRLSSRRNTGCTAAGKPGRSTGRQWRCPPRRVSPAFQPSKEPSVHYLTITELAPLIRAR
ncbi:MAG: hypothetical protein KDH48_05050, partial [Rhodoferax sp.]|nr:hypothetical protein [Rhodoferax sp.]